MTNLLNQLGNDLNPNAIRETQQLPSVAEIYRQMITVTAEGILTVTSSLLERLTKFQFEQLKTILSLDLNVIGYSKDGHNVYWFNFGEDGLKTLKDLDLADVLTIMEAAERVLRS